MPSTCSAAYDIIASSRFPTSSTPRPRFVYRWPGSHLQHGKIERSISILNLRALFRFFLSFSSPPPSALPLFSPIIQYIGHDRLRAPPRDCKRCDITEKERFIVAITGFDGSAPLAGNEILLIGAILTSLITISLFHLLTPPPPPSPPPEKKVLVDGA